jgi:alkylated DNA nucleotide flippase Atl1
MKQSQLKLRIPWKEKLERISEPKLVSIPPKMQRQYGKGIMAIARPLDMDVLIRKVKTGKLVTKSELRRKLAELYGADVTCPLTTGIFLRIIAECSEEDLRSGKKASPYWRVVNDNGSFTDTFPGGDTAQAKKLRSEGIKTGKLKNGKPFALNFEKALTHFR